MSAFEVKLTPNRLKGMNRVESNEPTDVIMSPFSAKAIVQFENVPITKSAKRILRVTNPSDDDIEVRVTKTFQPEHNVVLSWMEMIVPAQSSYEMEMTWIPLLEVACKETLQLTDNRNFRKDIIVILKSKNNNPQKNTRKFPTLSSGTSGHVKTLRLKTQAGKSQSKKSIAQTQQRKRQQKTEQPSPAPRWKNVAIVPPKKQHTTSTPLITYTHCPLTERNVQAHQERSPVLAVESTMQAFDTACDEVCKENASPLTPGNVLSLIDKLSFTPATAGRHDPFANLDNLATWPTPVIDRGAAKHVLLRDVRPRRISAFELKEEEASPSINTHPSDANNDCGPVPLNTFTDKTFEVRRDAEAFETFATTTFDEGSGIEAGRLSVGTAINKTTTVMSTPMARALHIINEEDGHSMSIEAQAVGALQNTYIKPSCESLSDLKRDIKLVGTPLRKYSKSMKDLSLPAQTKMAIQGSMPNLNEREIRSFEQNRYFHYQQQRGEGMSIIHEHNSQQSLPLKNCSDGQKDANEGAGRVSPNSSDASEVSRVDVMFNQSEILAQSSRFNVNEVGLKSARNSPKTIKFISTGRFARMQTPPKVVKKLIKQENDEHDASQRPQKKRSLYDSSFSADSEYTGDTVDSVKFDRGRFSSIHLSPPKRQRLDGDASLQQLRATPTNASAARNRSWAQTQPKKFKEVRTLSLIKKEPVVERIRLYDSELYLKPYINPDPFAATTTCDPFLAASMYLDECAVNKHIEDFKKWLNALVTIPAELNADCNAKIDVGKLFNEVRHKKLTLAPTKEEQSMNYLTQSKLESLRRAAVQLYLSEDMRQPCSKVSVYVSKNAISIRSDRNLHLDVVMQRQILELLLCFNPLWLRLGLEVVFGEKIHLHSNNDILELSDFILNRLFRNKYLEDKYARAYKFSEEYADHIKKFTLQNLLCLLLFLDTAKSRRIVKHNPCLFVKTSPYKETKDILLRLSSELLASIGDITRVLKRLGYVLQHKQNFIDEFDYAFHHLGVDLRDGIRLTRIMEIILLRDDLTRQLRAPAISRLQRIFNVNLALLALRDADFELRGDIKAADIVNGHREKTLSLLWQIIYKFRSPKFHEAARVLQGWWRRSLLRVIVTRRIRAKEEQRLQMAATRLQAFYRGYLARKYCRAYAEERTRAAVVLQMHIRCHQARSHFHRALRAIAVIQSWYRAQRLGREDRRRFVALRSSTVFVQRLYRRGLLAKKLMQLATLAAEMREVQRRETAAIRIQAHWRGLKRMQVERDAYLALRTAATNVQRHFRAQLATRRHIRDYQGLRAKVIYIQRKWRATLLAHRLQQQFVTLRFYATLVQQKFRANKQMRIDRTFYAELRAAVVAMQRRLRANRCMRVERTAYEKLRSASVLIQQKFRANRTGRQEQVTYRELRAAILVVQCRFRANRLMHTARLHFLQLRATAIKVQRRFRAKTRMRAEHCFYKQLRLAVVQVQQKFRANKLMRLERTSYGQLRESAIKVQRRFRANRAMLAQRSYYQRLRPAVIAVQQRFRANRLRRSEHSHYQQLRLAVVQVQQKFRANKLMRLERTYYGQLRESAIKVQRRFRANRAMLAQRSYYQRLRPAVIAVQQRFRANRLRRSEHSHYQQLRLAVVQVQQKFRANKLMRLERTYYGQLRESAIKVQRRFRANRAMLAQRSYYQRLRPAVIAVQQRFRANRLRRSEHSHYQQLRLATVQVQQKFRANKLMRLERTYYGQLRESAIKVQRRFRANRAMLAQRSYYQRLGPAVIAVQQRFRANRLRRSEHSHYQQLRLATVQVQQKFRANKLMRLERTYYGQLRESAIKVQRRFRANRAMLAQRSYYQRLRPAVIAVQQRFRANRLRRSEHSHYQQLRLAVVQVQQKFRANKLMRLERTYYGQLRESAIKVQRRFRANRAMLAQRSYYQRLRPAVIAMQQRFRANRLRRSEHSHYQQLRLATVQVQQKFRANKLMRLERTYYGQLRESAIKVQRRFRANRAMLAQRSYYQRLRPAVIAMQQRFRANRLRRSEHSHYQQLRLATVQVQQKFRANKLMRLERTYYGQLRESAIKVQRRFRANRAMLAQRSYYQRLRPAVIAMQQRFRANRLRRSEHSHYQQLRLATVQVQQKFRANKLMRLERTYYGQLRESAIKVQRRFRANRAMLAQRSYYQRLRPAVIAMQQRFRANRLRRSEHSHYQQLRLAVVQVQQKFRANKLMRLERTYYGQLREGAIKVQRRFRANRAMLAQRSYYQRLRPAVIAMQQRFRANRLRRSEHSHYQQLRLAVVQVQQKFRANKLMRLERTYYGQLRESAIKVQRRFRANRAMLAQRSYYQRLRPAVIAMQQRFRANRLRRSEHSHYQQLRLATVQVQQKFRANKLMRLERSYYGQLRESVIKVQRRFRANRAMLAQCSYYQRLRPAVIAMQQRYRAQRLMRHLRCQYQLLRLLIVCIQRRYRAHRAMLAQRTEFVKLKNSVVVLQQHFRANQYMRKQYAWFQQLRVSAVQFQAHTRGWLSRKRFQALMTPEMVELRQRRKATCTIQRVWRGYRIRKCVRSQALQQIRANIASRIGKAPVALSIRARMLDSVRILRGRYSSSEALQVLIRIDRLSRTVPHLLMKHADFIATFCYDIMAQTIRSEVDKQLIRYCSRIILNLARYNSTTVNTFQQGGLTTIAQMLLRWCDKDSEIFNTLCTLIWIFAHCARKRRIIREYMTTAEAIYVVRETKKLVARKEKMLKNVRKSSVALMPRNDQQSTFSSRTLPALQPDYGVANNQPYTFISSVYAFDTILFKLGIDVY